MEDDAVIARARAMLGTRFRFQGRDAEGMDCVGLAAHAHQLHAIPQDYDLRTADAARWMILLDGLMARHDGPLMAGSIVLMRAGVAQLHLGLWTGAGLIHADAGLRRVVETPGQPIWPILGQWQPRREDPWQP